MGRRPGNSLRRFAEQYAQQKAAERAQLPMPSWDASPTLDLGSPAADATDSTAAKKPRKRALKLTTEIPKPLERVTHRAIVRHVNSHLKGGGVFHVPNEGLVDLLPPTRRNSYINALEADGMLLGNADLFAVWGMPDEWRDALVAAGFQIPDELAFCAALEVKREGWKPDKRWREGRQPKAHLWLRAKGVPVRIVRGVEEAQDFLEACGAPLRIKLLRPATPREGTHDTAQAASGRAKQTIARRENREGVRQARRVPQSAQTRTAHRLIPDAPPAKKSRAKNTQAR